MSLTSLIDGSVEKYIAENRATQGCWFFVHIPKTAGSSFRRELAEMLMPNHHIHIDRDKRDLPYKDKLDDATKDFNDRLKQPGRKPCRFASGHVPITTLASLVEDWRSLKYITMLRDPVKRVISDYRYQTTPVHPGHAEFVERFPRLEAFVEESRARNKMYRFLRPTMTSSLEECIEFMIEHFAFVGDLEHYSASFRLVMRLLDQEKSPSWYIRKTTESDYNQIQITPELVARLRDLNSLDVALYDYFSRILQPVWDKMPDQPATAETA